MKFSVASWLLAAALLCACEGGAPSPSATAPQLVTVGTRLAADQTLVRTFDAMPRTVDPSILTDVDAQHLCDELFEGLTAFGADGSMVPGVASSWETSADGRSWTFHLRPEARWSNGEPVTAADFVYAWKRQVDPKTGTEYAQALTPIVNALAIAKGEAPLDSLGVNALDPRTLRVALNNPTPYLLWLLADSFMQPLPRATIERWGDDWTRPEHIVSNGPFVLKELVIGNRVTIEKNPRYWDAANVHLSRVIYYPLEDANIQVSRYLAGDVQFTSTVPLSAVNWLRMRLGQELQIGPYNGVKALALNMLEPPFKPSPELRLAMTMALDREVLAGKIEQGVSQPAYTISPPMPGYAPPVPQWAHWSAERRHAEARRLYAAAGYSTAHPLRLQLDYPTADSSRDYFDAAAAMWRVNLGADIEPYNKEFRVLLQDLRLHKSKLFWNGWIGDYPDPYTFLQLFQTGFDQNFGAHSNARYDALLDAAAKEPDAERRIQDLAQAEALLNEIAPYIPLTYYTSQHLIKPYVKGWHFNLQDRIVSRYLYVLEHQGN